MESFLRHGYLNYQVLVKEIENQSVPNETNLRTVFIKLIQGHWIRRISGKDYQIQSTPQDTDQALLFPQTSSGKSKSMKNGATSKDKGVPSNTLVQDTFSGEPSKVCGRILWRDEWSW